ncbi:MAG: hypothetical protein ACD_67C00170G0004 [uncultured bacterium]|nr:MAG: hypothetical protein ACD_67C00170G0004 [uncultured bacterium]
MSFGKAQQRKDLMEIVNAHGIKYLAQSNVAFVHDLKKKAKKALETSGPSFLLVLQPCTQLWKFPTSEYVALGKLATETNFWPLYEIEDGKYTINNIVKSPKPIEEFLKLQGRFKHLFAEKNKEVIVDIQKTIDANFEKLAKKAQNS